MCPLDGGGSGGMENKQCLAISSEIGQRGKQFLLLLYTNIIFHLLNAYCSHTLLTQFIHLY